MSAQILALATAATPKRLAARRQLERLARAGIVPDLEMPGYLSVIRLCSEARWAGLEVANVADTIREIDALRPHEDGLGLAPVVPLNGPRVTPFRSLMAAWLYFTAERDFYRGLEDFSTEPRRMLSREEANALAPRQRIGTRKAAELAAEIATAQVYSKGMRPDAELLTLYDLLDAQRATKGGD